MTLTHETPTHSAFVAFVFVCFKVGVLAARKDHWLTEGIVVKVMNKKLGGGKYYKAKGVVKEVVDR